ncbi:ATP-grasp ribosomal peptide maturase [Streptomyces sp. DSM 42041]|uniref:ATP-grasp ribosomal peptide maturase n=1 Tax=Streptomyces hazeniae TaxID=3075538 RepID=A0ABU2NPL3_9ACTN|nr:ATP-grasp ribosomal peptide maturase [Streptomyces sp. DSM 42041]MDT0378397.1 ATP-grasp ribosomal peptide maturase [Streptomyces sp. DSM 42041]
MVTQLDDPTADEVIAELNRRSVPVARLDPGAFPQQVTLCAEFGSEGLRGDLFTATRTVGLSQVRSVYWRRPSPYRAGAGLEGEDERWAVEQARYGVGGVLAAIPGALFVNHPWRNRDAEYKPAQLGAAAACGMRVPPTLITNDPGRARAFAREHAPVVYKPLRETGYRDGEGRTLTVWVEDARADDIDEGVAATAHLFQQRVAKVADVRLTVVGDRFFAVRIDGSPGVDWRRHYEDLSYTVIDVPGEVAKAVHAYMGAFGLTFGAFDFGLDARGRFWWYECNPNGQWAWFPQHITQGIAAALADQLQHPRQALL